ncbi:MAG: bifunctional demethylmenaquinone methyltransferase/2-methoxy-6-polyprenyl-1,4-benzoquinol methylase UbiE [Tannerellaceae bacterium]|jgi:demethylmenaquinone methyltransferase/2-methoxy-6-polyprenyl-1,4-benzoquinol methylase|nr:bifunctional demethylmenaquinone methyltransferase/2-methoxy-6-polyprenyl-1,4-benzoquinol methylase UbiE [Tannerellaceae bacterium]
MFGSEKILPYESGEHKSAQIGRMFDAIAETYDTLNHTLSLGIDKGWRKKGIAFLRPFAPGSILDVATGTGDLALAMYETLHPRRITAIDLSEGMMEVGRRKAAEAGHAAHISFERQDCLSLTYPDHSFDAVTSAFGVRNFEHIEQGIAEMYRVLKPGGHLMILELSHPRRFPVKQLYTLYSQTVIPWLGRLYSKENAAYRYLPASVKVVPQGTVMADILRRQGFIKVGVRTFTLGICSLYTGEKTK